VQGQQGRVSPDGRWLAYVSNETGEPQVYVTTFPVPGERRRVSLDGGRDPQWDRTGRELFYVAGNNLLTAVPVNTGKTFELGTPEPLFRVSRGFVAELLESVYAPAAGGQRFLVNQIVGADERNIDDDAPTLTVMLNWAVGAR
jgi:hypothetical protein